MGIVISIWIGCATQMGWPLDPRLTWGRPLRGDAFGGDI